jgi:hypothetical protein
MNTDPFVLIDRERRGVFGWLAESHRPFRDAHITTDGAGVTWMWAAVGESAVGLTWLGPGHVWDADWASAHAAGLARRREAMTSATPPRHQAEFAAHVSGLRLGDLARRVLYAVHRAVLAQKSSLVTVWDGWLAGRCWGSDTSARPRHWRSVLRAILGGLRWLHVADRAPGGATPAFGAQTVLITHAGDLLGAGDDVCPGDCGARTDARHHHFQIDVGPGFLGLLERFGCDADGAGVRTYQFPLGGKRTPTSLRALGKSGRLVSAFAPALLGEPDRCRTISTGGHHILQALVRETTRPLAPGPDADPRAEVVTGGRVRSYSARKSLRCGLLASAGAHVGFNGNGKRKAMGFRLGGDWGWPVKAGYHEDAAPAFLDDLAGLVDTLHLTVVGVGPSDTFYTLSQLRGMPGSAAGRNLLPRVDVRVFAPPDYARRWSAYFGWDERAGRVADRPEFDVRAEMRSRGLSCRALAAAVGCDHSFLAKVLNDTKSKPAGLLEKVRAYLAGHHDLMPWGGLAGPVWAPSAGSRRTAQSGTTTRGGKGRR